MNAVRLDGLDEVAVAALAGLPRAVHVAAVGSTMDEAHRLAAAGAEAGTVIVADEQTAGRGRGGRRWASRSYCGLWLTLIERPLSASGLDVLSLRLGLREARVLERFTDAPVRMKWPNDLYVGSGKLAGILVEARWRDQRVDWVAIGIGVNIGTPLDLPSAAGVRPGTRRSELFSAVVPALRAAAAIQGPLTDAELGEYAARDCARGRRCTEPAAGVVRGITADGALLVESPRGKAQYRAGSLVLAREAE